MVKLNKLAKVIRSKNAGPYEITFDILFSDETTYLQVKNCGVLTPEYVANLYKVNPSEFITFMFYDPALAFKFTLPRSRDSEQGSVGERDTFGAQQHAPLLDIEIPF